MTKLSKEQRIQEEEYTFPYHHIPRWDNGSFTQTYNLAWGFEYASYTRFVLDIMENLSFESVLDVGCGDGKLLHEVSRRFPEKRLLGIDHSEQAVKLATALSPGIEYLSGDIKDPSLLPGSFDLITLIETLEHIPPDEIADFLKGLHHYLKPDGTLIITVPSVNIKMVDKHYQHFTLKSLDDTIKPYFSISTHYFINMISFQAKVLGKMLTNKLYILNEKRLVNWIFGRYERNLLKAQEKKARRICAVCKKNSVDMP